MERLRDCVNWRGADNWRAVPAEAMASTSCCKIPAVQQARCPSSLLKPSTTNERHSLACCLKSRSRYDENHISRKAFLIAARARWRPDSGSKITVGPGSGDSGDYQPTCTSTDLRSNNGLRFTERRPVRRFTFPPTRPQKSLKDGARHRQGAWRRLDWMWASFVDDRPPAGLPTREGTAGAVRNNERGLRWLRRRTRTGCRGDGTGRESTRRPNIASIHGSPLCDHTTKHRRLVPVLR